MFALNTIFYHIILNSGQQQHYCKPPREQDEKQPCLKPRPPAIVIAQSIRALQSTDYLAQLMPQVWLNASPVHSSTSSLPYRLFIYLV